jgi:hypothetical protein
MMAKKAAGLALIALAGLGAAGCGLRAPLQPAPGETLPQAPPLSARPLTSDELLTPPQIARPERVDELLRRSETREDDRFDLPPPGTAGPNVPLPRPREPVRPAPAGPESGTGPG